MRKRISGPAPHRPGQRRQTHAAGQCQPARRAVTELGGSVLTCKGKGLQATGYEANQGFVVREGSQAVVAVTNASSKTTGVSDLLQFR